MLSFLMGINILPPVFPVVALSESFFSISLLLIHRSFRFPLVRSYAWADGDSATKIQRRGNTPFPGGDST